MIVTSTQASGAAGTATATTPAAAAIGKRLNFYANFDNIGGTITGPAGASVLVAVGAGTGGSEHGSWYLDLVGAPAANYTVSTSAGGDVGLVITCTDGEGGDFVSDTPVAITSGDSNTATTGTFTNPAADVVVGIAAFVLDVDGTIATPPAGMTLQQFVDMGGSALAVYSHVGFTTGTKVVVWSTSEEWLTSGVVTRYTAPVSGPTVDTQPTAGTVVIHNSSTPSKVFTVEATTSGGDLEYQWQVEDSVGAGTYTDIEDGGIHGGALTDALTVTPVSKAASNGIRYRCNVTDDNGTTTTNAVALTVYNGFQFTSSVGGVTNGSGQFAATWSDDRPGSLLGDGGFTKHNATSGASVSHSSGRPT